MLDLIESPHVLREVERASSKGRPVLSVRMDATELPPEAARSSGSSRRSSLACAAQHDGTLVQLKFDPLLANLHADRRIAAMVKVMGLPP